MLTELLHHFGYTWNHKINGNQALFLLIVSASWKQISYNFLFFLAGLHAGVWSNVGDIVRIRESAHIFRPKMDAESAQELCRRWHKAVERAKDWE